MLLGDRTAGAKLLTESKPMRRPRGRLMGRARLCGLAAAVLTASLSLGTEADPIVLKVHHFTPATSTLHKDMIVPWCEKIRADSKGALSCQIYPAMQLGGSPTQLYDQVRDGVVDVVFAVPGFTAGRFPRIEVFELPFMMSDAEASSKALWDYVAQVDQAEFADVKPLAFNVHGPGLFHMIDKPIVRRSDLRGLKIRAPTRAASRLIAVLGGTPVGMPLPQIPEALSKGVIDGVVIPWEVVPTIRVNELTRFHSETDPSHPAIYTTAFVFAMNKARYQSLSPDLRKVIDANSGVALSAMLGRAMSDADAHGRASVPANSINRISSVEVAQWMKLTQPVIDAWIAEMNKQGADGSSLLATARNLTKKYQP